MRPRREISRVNGRTGGRAPVRSTIIRTGLETLYFSGAHLLMRPFFAGVGAILMLHHVRPSRSGRFQPNHLLEVTPWFFETVIRRLRRSKVDLISLDEMHRRLTTGDYPRRRFVCVTFDDGYRDNLQFAYPVLKRYEVPFTIYVATSFADRTTASNTAIPCSTSASGTG